MYVLTNSAGTEIGTYAGTPGNATEWARKLLEDDPELGHLELYSVRAEDWTHVKTITHGPDANWNSVVVVLEPGEKIQPPSAFRCNPDESGGFAEVGFVRPAPNPENKFELFHETFESGYELADPKHPAHFDTMVGFYDDRAGK